MFFQCFFLKRQVEILYFLQTMIICLNESYLFAIYCALFEFKNQRDRLTMENKSFLAVFLCPILFCLVIGLFLPLNSSANIPLKDEKVPDSIVALTHGYAVVVDKENQRLYVFQKSERFHKVFEAPCSTGKNPGPKKEEGDGRTPNGIFFVTRVINNPGDPEIFGSMAFPLDYPTVPDKRANRNGGNIWIHGTTKKLFPRQSNGCVVLQDNDLKRLANFIFLNKTPVIISESIRWVPQTYVSAAKRDLEAILMSWNRAFIEKDWDKIDSLYLRGAEIKGERRRDLNEKINQAKSLGPHFLLQPRDISILHDDGNAVIMFDQIYAVSSAKNYFYGFYNKLFLEKINGKWYIIDDAGEKTAPPVERAESKALSPEQEVRKLIQQWLGSWQSGNMAVYRRCYDEKDFQSRGMNLDDWIAHKTSVRRKSNDIKISIADLKISAGKNKAVASFTQSYRSSVMRSKGKKTLELKKIGNEWKITREIM